MKAALGAQSEACDQVASFLEHMLGQNRETESSVGHLDRTMRELLAEAADLRAAVERFALEEAAGPDSARGEVRKDRAATFPR